MTSRYLMVVNMDFGAKAPLYVYNLYHSWFFLILTSLTSRWFLLPSLSSPFVTPFSYLARLCTGRILVPARQRRSTKGRCTENVVQPTLSSTIPFLEACQFSSYAIYTLHLPLRIQQDATTIHDWKLTILSFRILMYAIHLALQLLG